MCMKLEVKVTNEDIRLGKPGESDKCAIARVLTKNGYKMVAVDSESIECNKFGVRWTAKTPSRAAKFVKKFDKEEYDEDYNCSYPKKVKPISFNLKLEPKELVQQQDQDIL